MDGHTPEGSYEVSLTLSGDQAKQLARLVDMAKMMDGRDIKIQDKPETFDIIAYRAFLEEILQILYKAIEQYSTDKPS